MVKGKAKTIPKKAVKPPPKQKKRARQRLNKTDISKAKQFAFMLYTENGIAQNVISEITGISEKTLTAWKKEDNWEEQRDMQRIGPKEHIKLLLETLKVQLEAIKEAKRAATPAEADAIGKLTDSIKDLQQKALTFSDKSATGKQFITYIQDTYGQAKALETMALWHEYLMATS